MTLSILHSDGGGNSAFVATNTTTDTVIKASPGRLCKVVVTTSTAVALSIWDNASGHTGNLLLTIPASAAAGTIYSPQILAQNGITVQGASTIPGVAIGFD
jgi:hypothetical protein